MTARERIERLRDALREHGDHVASFMANPSNANQVRMRAARTALNAVAVDSLPALLDIAEAAIYECTFSKHSACDCRICEALRKLEGE